MTDDERKLAKKATAKILKEFGVYSEDDWYNQDEVEGAVLYENLKAGVVEEYDVDDDDMNEILEELFDGLY